MQSIRSLMLDDLKLKNDLVVLLSALGSNSTLTELDIRSVSARHVHLGQSLNTVYGKLLVFK